MINHMRASAVLVALVIAFALSDGLEAQTGRIKKEAKDFNSYYLLEVPKEYDPSKPWPLLVSLHGAGGNAENFINLWAGIAPKKGYILAVPCGDAKAPEWNNTQRTWSGDSPRFILWMVAEIRKAYKIDPDRIYLNGFSAGGHMTLFAGLKNPDVFCALVPCSGCVMPQVTDQDLEKAKTLPVRFLVGVKDPNYTPVQQSVDRLKAAGFKTVLLREFPDLAHQYPAEENPKILQWFDEVYADRLEAKGVIGGIAGARKALEEGLFGDAARAAKKAVDAGIGGAPGDEAKAILDMALAAGRQMLAEAKRRIEAGDALGALDIYARVSTMFRGFPAGDEAAETDKSLKADPGIRARVEEQQAEARLASDEQEASALLVKAAELCQKKEWSAALDALDRAASRFPSTPSGGEAAKRAAALRADPSIMNEASSARNLKKCTSWFQLAENYVKNGSKSKAAELYRKVAELMPDSEIGKKARSRLASLK